MLQLLKSLLIRVKGMDIVKVFSFNVISTLVKMLAGMASVKIIATIIGPTGIALLGQLSNITNILLGIANGGIQSGITKYVAEHKDNESIIRGDLSNALKITLLFTTITAITMILLHRPLSRWILLSEEFGYVFEIFGFTIILYTLNMMLISIVNGFKDFTRYIRINICGTLFGLVCSVILVASWGLTGAMINAVTYQSVVFFITLFMCRRCVWLRWENFRGRVDYEIWKKYLRYSLMTLTTLSLTPVSQMILRGYVMEEISPIEAGWWEAMNRISGVYLTVITSSFSVYYLPRLSEIKDNRELRAEIFRCYKVIIPILLIATLTIYLARFFIIQVLLTPEFYPMESYFLWQMLGDLFKIAGWLLAYLMLAKAMTRAFIATEMFFSATLLAFSFLFIRISGTIGLTQAYLANYILYTVVMIYMFRKLIFLKKR